MLDKLIIGYPNNAIEFNDNDAKLSLESSNEILPRQPSLSCKTCICLLTLALSDSRRRSIGSSADLHPKIPPAPNQKTMSHSIISDDEKASLGLADLAASNVKSDESGRASPGVVHQKHLINLPDAETLAKSKPMVATAHTVKTDPYVCDCGTIHNEQKLAVNIMIPLSVEKTWQILFGYNSEFIVQLWSLMKYSGNVCFIQILDALLGWNQMSNF